MIPPYKIPRSKTRKYLNEMLKDEAKAPKDYAKLLKVLNKEKDKQVVRGIIQQEKQHYRKLEKIKKREI